MSHESATLSTTTDNLPAIVEAQKRYTWRRVFLRDYLLRPLGFRIIVKPTFSGLEHVPTTGPTLLIMNHIAFPDPVVVLGAIKARFVVPMSKIENRRNLLFGSLGGIWGVYYVDRSKIDRSALDNTLALLNAGHCVLIAPEGTRQPNLIEVKEGFTYVATKTNATIVPIGIEGTDLVANNMKRLRRTPIEARFGRAFRFKTQGRTRIPRDEMAQMTQEAMYQLAHLVNPERRGHYSDLTQTTTDTIEFV